MGFTLTVGLLIAGVVWFLIALLVDQPYLAAAGILAVAAARSLGASSLLEDGDPSWKRLRRYVWTSHVGMQYAARGIALLYLLVESGAFSIGLIRLASATVLATLLAGYLLPAFYGAAFSLQMDAVGLPGYDSASRGLRLFNGTNVRFRALLVRCRIPIRWLEAAVLVTLLILGEDAGTVIAVLLGIQLAVACLNIVAICVTVVHDVARKSFALAQAAVASGVAAYQPELLLYFSASSADSIYQPAQWAGAFAATGRVTLVMTRERELLEALDELGIGPVVWVRQLSDLDAVVPESARLAFYVNNGVKNGHFLRLNQLVHVQLLHGESDKAASVAKTTRAFDSVFVAGQAAIDRYEAAGVGIPEFRFAVVGRPITDRIVRTEEGRAVATVLYAPTWEGFDDLSDWTSVGTSAMTIMQALRERTEIRVIFKPHPLTGDTRSSLHRKLAEIEAFVETDPRGVDRYLGPESPADLYDLFNESDALITDLSSVLADYLRSGKPILVTDPKDYGAERVWDEFPTTVGSYVLGSDPVQISTTLDDAFGEDTARPARHRTASYVLGDFEGSATAQFVEAVERLLEED